VTPHCTSRAALAPGRSLALQLGVLLAALLLTSAPAGAEVVQVETESGPRQVGLQPTSIALAPGLENGPEGTPHAANFNNPGGAPVMHSVDAYVIYWDPQDLYHGEWQGLIDRYMSDLSAASENGGNDVFTVDAQYTDLAGNATGKTRFLGAYTDTNPYPSAGCKDEYLPAAPANVSCVNDAQIQEQLHVFIGHHDLQTGMGTIFFVLTPPGVGVCVDSGPSSSHCAQDNGAVSPSGLCSYHSYYPDPQLGTVLYAAIPWTAGDLGGIFGGTSTVCQDGGWNENAEQGGPLKKTAVPQEPNQLSTVGGDGTYDEGLADLIVNQMAAEQQNTITDPLLNAWQDKESLKGKEIAYENTDECRDWFLLVAGGGAKALKHTEAGTLFNQELDEGIFYLNDAFNLAALKLSYPGIPCMPGIKLVPSFTEPPAVNSGEIVGFNGMESNITLNAGEKFINGEEKPTYPTFTWDFGDGTPVVSGYAPGGAPANPPTTLCEEPWLPPCAASVFHSYQYGGVYKVTLTVTDVAGNAASVTTPITVAGPPPPAPPPPTPTAGPGGSSSGGAGGSSGSSSTTPAIPGPVATAATVSNSLKQVARSGLVVNYSVNEQVAGHFEVLLEAGIARRLGISGQVATELPPGFPRSLVIAHALLVTTKGGHSSVRIKFSKRTAQRLRHAHSVKLTLRLIVHNAATQSPVFTKVMSSTVLHR
jgi:hypothetical protein